MTERDPATEDGSSPRMLWQSLLGIILGLVTVPVIAYLLTKLIVALHGRGAVPFGFWGTALGFLLVIETALGLRLRRLSDMCAVSFGIAAFFSLLSTIGMMTEMTSLLLPKLG